jgi:hypothetical protein
MLQCFASTKVSTASSSNIVTKAVARDN